MSLSIIAIRELQRELVQLERTRVNLSARISAIQALVGERKPQEQADRADSTLRPANSPTKSSGSATKRHRAVVRKAPFSVAVLRTVTATPGLKPQQVTEVLKKAGYSTRRKTGLHARVYNTMYDMVRKGVLQKTVDGGYVAETAHSITASSTSGAPSQPVVLGNEVAAEVRA